MLNGCASASMEEFQKIEKEEKKTSKKKKQCKTGLVTNWKKSSSDEMGFKNLVFMQFPNKFV